MMSKVFYGWKMVAAGAGMQFLHSALMYQSFGAYFALLMEEFGWSKTAIAVAAALQPMEAAILGPFLGWVLDRFGPQRMIRLGVVIMSLGFAVFATVDSLATFYFAFFVIALGSSLCGFFPMNVAVIHWFERKRARALSMMALGLALGGVAVPLVAVVMQGYGWRVAALASAVVILVVGWPIARVIRGRPERYGEYVDGEPPTIAPAGVPQEAPRREFSAGEALRTRAFWMISLGHGFALLVVSAVNVHAVSHLTQSLDLSLVQASGVVTLMTVAQVGGVLLSSAIGDRFDKRHLSALCMLMHSSGLLMLAYATGPAMLLAFALLHGCGWGLRGPLMQAIRADFFGKRAIGMILGISSLIMVIGQVGGPMLAAVVADLTGHYRIGFTILACAAGLGAGFFLFARRPA